MKQMRKVVTRGYLENMLPTCTKGLDPKAFLMGMKLKEKIGSRYRQCVVKKDTINQDWYLETID